MLTQIKKIKNFGVFGDYTGNVELPLFGRYNVVYGENGSGKTTLSRLLSCLEVGTHADHPNLEFAIESLSGQLTHGSRCARKVRVFNSDYVEANIGRLDGPLRYILILGEENKALAEQLKQEIGTKERAAKSDGEGHSRGLYESWTFPSRVGHTFFLRGNKKEGQRAERFQASMC
ncbi:wobble nucleotide-excising tRNase [Nitrobacteraceae bacterium AZCC 2161]